MKKLFMMASTIFAVFSLAACNNNAQESNVQENNTASQSAGSNSDRPFEGQTLTLGIWRGNDIEFAAIELVREEFEAQTGATIDWRMYDDINVQLLADFAAGIAPDAFYVESFWAQFYIDQGVLKPLDPATFNADMFYGNLLDAFTVDGVLYAIPKDQSSLARYVNTSLLEAVGLTISDIPNDVESYLTFLPELQARLNAEFGPNAVMAASGMFEPSRVLHWITRNGGQPVTPEGFSNLSDPIVVEHMEFIVSLFNTGAMRTPEMIGSGWNGEAFGLELAVIMEEGNWVYNFLDNEFPNLEFEVIDMPTYQGERSSMSFTVGWGIYADSSNHDLAEEWLRFKTGPEGMYLWTTNAGPLPTRTDVAERISSNLSSGLNAHVAQSDVAIAWNLGMFGPLINDAFMNYMRLAIDGTISVEEALQNADAQANMMIDFR